MTAYWVDCKCKSRHIYSLLYTSKPVHPAISFDNSLSSPLLDIGMKSADKGFPIDGMSYVDNHSQFRFPLALQCLFAVLTIALMLVLPESPRWVSNLTIFQILGRAFQS